MLSTLQLTQLGGQPLHTRALACIGDTITYLQCV